MPVMEFLSELKPALMIQYLIFFSLCPFKKRMILCIQAVPVYALFFGKHIMFLHYGKSIFKISGITAAHAHVKDHDAYDRYHDRHSGPAGDQLIQPLLFRKQLKQHQYHRQIHTCITNVPFYKRADQNRQYQRSHIYKPPY